MFIRSKVFIVWNLFFTFLLFFLIIPDSKAQNIEFKATVNRTEIGVDDRLLLSLVSTGGKASDPEFPYLNDWEVDFKGTSSEMKIVNGSISVSETFSYTLTPRKRGILYIDPIKASINGKYYQTELIKITVKDSPKVNVDKSKNIFITAHVNNTNPYVNEQIVYTFRFYRKVDSSNHIISFPKFDDFWIEELGKEKSYEQMINGERYRISEIKKVLSPTKPGNLNIERTKFTTDVHVRLDNSYSFFSRTVTEKKDFYSSPIKLNVKALPKNGKPKSFKGTVGNNLSVKNKVNKPNSLKVGDSVTLDLIIEGKSNINDLVSPEINISNKVKVYQDKAIENKKELSNGIYYKKNFKYAIVPTEPGKLLIPEVEFTYFDPKLEKYITKKTIPISLEVTGEKSSVSLNNISNQNNKNNKLKNEKFSEDILTIETRDKTIKNQNLEKKEVWIYILVGLFLIIIYLLIYSFKNKLKINLSKNNDNNVKKVLQKINSLEKKIDNENFGNDLSNIFKSYLEEKKENKQINNSEVNDKIKALIVKYDFIKFSGQKINQSEKKELISSTKEIIQDVEKVAK